MKISKLFLILVFLGLAAGILSSQPAQAQTPVTPVSDDQVNAVAREMYCPVCENIPLDVCPTTACAQWRELIRLKLSEGWNKDQIKEYFANQYGDRVLSEPPRRGLNLLVYILPPIFFVAGAVIVWWVFRNSRKSRQAEGENPPLDPGEQDDILKRIEEDLRRRDKES